MALLGSEGFGQSLLSIELYGVVVRRMEQDKAALRAPVKSAALGVTMADPLGIG